MGKGQTYEQRHDRFADDDGAGGIDPGVLAKVRALLAKAESTPYEAEAAAFTAKAQELITRHAIDHALLDVDPAGAGPGRGAGGPGDRRITIDDPYARAKLLLLSAIAAANRCRVVWLRPFGYAQVFGFRRELDAVELLFTSLLLQATTAMLAEGPQRDARGRSRTRSFRQAFLVGFADRIGVRLRQAAASSVAQAERERGSGSVLPVLANRDEQVAEAFRAAFPHTVRLRTGASNRDGWMAGRTAADRASFSVGEPVGGGRRALR